jgi:hypothetical protein
MLQVICVKVGDKFGPELVTHLQRGIALNLAMDHDFACLTDNPKGLKCRDIPIIRDDLPGWWQKVTLFAPELRKHLSGNRVLYLDLDVVIRGLLDPMVSHPAPFVTIKDLWQQDNPLNSSFMLWYHDQFTHVYEEFDPEVMGQVHGDQNYIDTKVDNPLFINEVWPEWVKSFKIELKHTAPVNDERIVYFHGLPRPWDVEWVREHWNKQKNG